MVRTNEKRNDTTDRRRTEWLEWRGKFKAKMRHKYDPRYIARAPISSDDSDAVTKLQAKIDRAQRLQDLMKAANKIAKSKKLTHKQKIEQLAALPGFDIIRAETLLEPDYMGCVGFAPYQLSNNNANIRRMQERIKQIEREQERELVADRVVAGVTVVENTELNRLQLVFPDKPPVWIRKLFRSRGFIWAGSQGAWQRQLNDAARYAAGQVLERIGG